MLNFDSRRRPKP